MASVKDLFVKARQLHRREVSPATAARHAKTAANIDAKKLTAQAAKALRAITSAFNTVAEGKDKRILEWKDETMKALYAPKVYKSSEN